MNYFEFYELSPSFLLDQKKLKKQFFLLSKKFHPDFYTLEDIERQSEVLELSTFNNEAYKVLSDFDKRMEYLLKLEGILEEEGKNEVPQAFLMEMMELNEALMELEMDFDPDAFAKVQANINSIQEELYEEVLPLLDNYAFQKTSSADLNTIKNYFFKKKYLLRIQNNLSKFASL